MLSPKKIYCCRTYAIKSYTSVKMTIKLTGKYRVEDCAVAHCTQRVHGCGCKGIATLSWHCRFFNEAIVWKQTERKTCFWICCRSVYNHSDQKSCGWGRTRGREWHYVTLHLLQDIQAVGILCWYMDLWAMIFRPIRTRGKPVLGTN